METIQLCEGGRLVRGCRREVNLVRGCGLKEGDW